MHCSTFLFLRRIRVDKTYVFLYKKKFSERRRSDKLTLRFDFGKIAVIHLLTTNAKSRNEMRRAQGSHAKEGRKQTGIKLAPPNFSFARFHFN